MIAMWMVQMAIDQVVDMIAMRDCLVSAAGTVYMVSRMCAACVVRRAGLRVGSRYGDYVLVHVVTVWVVQVAVV